MNVITINNLSKTYQVSEREAGHGEALCSFFRRKFRAVFAVQEVNFSIQSGEIVGFLGPNSAGKTTTLKMLSGLLHPTCGSVHVLGFTPWERKREFLQAITLVMGQRNRLSWDIPAADSFLLNQAVYRLSEADYRSTLKELDDLLELAPIMRKPVRNLSLGERMKCELAAGLLHRPKVLFLDEPTIGLDITGILDDARVLAERVLFCTAHPVCRAVRSTRPDAAGDPKYCSVPAIPTAALFPDPAHPEPAAAGNKGLWESP